MIKKEILFSIFKRKGGEGVKTKLIKDLSILNNIHYNLSENENPILIYLNNDTNWILLTDIKIIINKNGALLELNHNNLVIVKPALSEEIKNGINKASDFTKLLLNFEDKSAIIIDVEKGPPYQGIYQMLHYISSNGR